jgi:hypothetical protein
MDWRMIVAKPKTKPTEASVQSFLGGVGDARQRADAFRIADLMQEITGKPAKMWGPTIVGFGEYHYVYASGHEGDACLAGFSPRKGALVLYFNAGLEERFPAQLRTLGKFKASKGCLYIKKLADVDLGVLGQMIRANVDYLAGLSNSRSKPAPTKKTRKKS